MYEDYKIKVVHDYSSIRDDRGYIEKEYYNHILIYLEGFIAEAINDIGACVVVDIKNFGEIAERVNNKECNCVEKKIDYCVTEETDIHKEPEVNFSDLYNEFDKQYEDIFKLLDKYITKNITNDIVAMQLASVPAEVIIAFINYQKS